MKMLATSRGWRRQLSHPEMQRPPASISGCNGSIRDVVDIFGCLRHPKMHEAIQDARSNSGCARILNCFMHLGMLEAISIKMEIVSGNLRCRSISNCGFPAPDGERQRAVVREKVDSTVCFNKRSVNNMDGRIFQRHPSTGSKPSLRVVDSTLDKSSTLCIACV